jgi:hypothetical protein
MIFNSKQLEELENIHDSTGAFEEEGEDESGFDEVGEAAMDWRRGLIEEAAENIKRAKGRPVESHHTYPIGSMLFERDARRFARVQRSVPGYLKIVYLSGGDREFGTLDVQAYLRDYGSDKRLSELSEQLGMNDGDVAIQLERLGITPLEEPDAPEEPQVSEEEAAAAAAAAALQAALSRKKGAPAGPPVELPAAIAPVVAAKAAAAKNKVPPPPPAAPTPVVRKSDSKTAAVKVERPVATKSDKADKAAKAKAPEKAPAKADKAVEKKAPAKAGKAINPIDDPNSYIKANYSEMSNRELARVTGLSEHTIRRKLGEWGLKRKAA